MSASSALYLVDTCVLVNIRDVYSDSEDVWNAVFQLIENGRLKTVRHVIDELERRFPDIYTKIKPYKKKFTISDADTYAASVSGEIRAIHAAHPNLYRMLGGKNPADPWLIAVAKHLNGIVLTDEKSSGKGHKSKIPWVCTNRNVGWTNSGSFFKALGFDV